MDAYHAWMCRMLMPCEVSWELVQRVIIADVMQVGCARVTAYLLNGVMRLSGMLELEGVDTAGVGT